MQENQTVSMVSRNLFAFYDTLKSYVFIFFQTRLMQFLPINIFIRENYKFMGRLK